MTARSIQNDVEVLTAEFLSVAEAVTTPLEIENLRIEFLGRKGKISHLFKILSDLPDSERKEVGKSINTFKILAEKKISEMGKDHGRKTGKKPSLDFTLPGNPVSIGRYHPITLVLRKVKTCFFRMGFSIAQGPEIETEYYNFEALNIPSGHPAREMHDTLFVQGGSVLRTHTSPVQIRVMESQKPPIRIIAPGRCYRRDTPDATHSPVFHQVEGLVVDEGVTFADLKGTILCFAQLMFGSGVKIRFRPSYFPFTEPSAEYDFSCFVCGGRGCRICKGSGWIEISGAGMVNPDVFHYVSIDSRRYTGFAFGMGLERIAMLMYQVNDIRQFYENDVRFLYQF